MKEGEVRDYQWMNQRMNGVKEDCFIKQVDHVQ